MVMDKAQIFNALEDLHGTSIPEEVSESDRWNLYEVLKSNLKGLTPDQYTKEIISIVETLEL